MEYEKDKFEAKVMFCFVFLLKWKVSGKNTSFPSVRGACKGLNVQLALRKITSLQPLSFSNFCEVWHG
jgi:hypothetical protein